jgi:chromosome partitioning protein
MIISLVNQKGGTGKTTIALNLAYAISKLGHKTLLVDADPQGSSLQWQAIANNNSFTVVRHPKANFHKNIEKVAERFKMVVIDAPPGTGGISKSILLCTNLAIVPVAPSPLDIWSSKEIIALIREIRKYNRKLRAKLLISKKIVGTTLGRDVRESLKGYRMGIFDTEICERIAYVKAIIDGRSVLEYAPNSEAANEIMHLTNELVKGR